MAKTMVIDGVTYVSKDEFMEELTEYRAKELSQLDSEALIKTLKLSNHSLFLETVIEVAKYKADEIAYLDSDILKDDYDYKNKVLQKKLVIIALL